VWCMYAGALIAVGCLLYPLGWNNAEVVQACTALAHHYRWGRDKVVLPYNSVLKTALVQVSSMAVVVSAVLKLERFRLPNCSVRDKSNVNVVSSFKGKGQYICIAPYCRQPTSKALRYGNALSRDHTVLPAHPRVYPRTE